MKNAGLFDEETGERLRNYRSPEQARAERVSMRDECRRIAARLIAQGKPERAAGFSRIADNYDDMIQNG